MNCKHHALLFLAALGGLASCSDDNPWLGAEGEGAIQLSLAADGSVADAIPIVRSDELFQLPAVEDFSIRLEKTDGSYSRTFATVADFRNEPGFPTGAYTLTAFYGNPEDEGFELPYLQGSTSLNVLEARTTEVSVTATVANSLISISYTDAFKNYLSDYSAQVHSEGHSYIDIPATETRPAFVAPGDVSLAVTFSNPQGQSVTLQPASFAAQAGHHYHITLDVNGGEVGQAQLSVIFDDSVESEDVVIDLTDELFSSAAPEVRPVGFASGDLLEFLAGSAPESQMRFNVIAHGGMREVVMTLASNDFTPAFGKEINLVGASDAQQQQLAELGFDIKGLFRNPDRMAIVDFSELPKHLPAGSYELSLIAKDNFTRVSDAVSISFTSVAPHLDVTPMTAIYGLNSASVGVAYNGSNPKEDVTFKALSKYGSYEEAPVTEVADATRSRSIETKNYIFNIKLPDTDREEIPVKVFLYGKEMQTVNIPVVTPEFSLETDALAKSVMVKVVADAAQASVIAQNLRFFDGTTAIEPSRIQRHSDSGIVTVSGLNPATSYTLAATLSSSLTGNEKQISFTTEAAAQVPNGDFSQTEETVNITGINNGGEYKAGVKSRCFNTTDITASVPTRSTGWATLNPLTCYEGSSVKNTWFLVPSAYMADGAVVLRSVAYSHNGTLPAYKNYGTFNYTYYSQNAPESISDRSAGELFLGSYSFSGSVSRTDGISFHTRPASVSFDYKYVSYAGEIGVATVAVCDAAGTVISTANVDLAATSSMTTKTIQLPAYPFGKKAVSLKISFKSTKGAVSTAVPSGSALDDTGSHTNGTDVAPPAGSGYHIRANQYKALSTGSMLTVDNVTLNY